MRDAVDVRGGVQQDRPWTDFKLPLHPRTSGPCRSARRTHSQRQCLRKAEQLLDAGNVGGIALGDVGSSFVANHASLSVMNSAPKSAAGRLDIVDGLENVRASMQPIRASKCSFVLDASPAGLLAHAPHPTVLFQTGPPLQGVHRRSTSARVAGRPSRTTGCAMFPLAPVVEGMVTTTTG